MSSSQVGPRNPFTGRKIQHGGATHRKLLRALDTIDNALHEKTLKQHGGHDGPVIEASAPQSMPAAPVARGKTVDQFNKEDKDFYSQLLTRTQAVSLPANAQRSKDDGTVELPQSKYMLISSALPPAPEEHSWNHHHAPFAQTFGDYVCLKRDTLRELGGFLRDALLH